MNNEKVKFLLNWNHFSEHLSSCMTKLMTDSSYSDIIIATADKHMIYSHRFVLANSSKYFQRLLKHMKRQSGIQLVVALPEIKYDIFKILMNYMYRGETQVPHELLPSVIKAGQFLEINGLVNLNENDNSGTSDCSVKFSSTEESHPRCSIIHSSNSGNNHSYDNSTGRVSLTLRDKIHSTENTNNSSKNVLHAEKRTKQNADECQTKDSPATGESGKENRSKLTKLSKYISQEKKDFIQSHLKRKSSMRESTKATSSSPSPSSSLSAKSAPPKKIQKTLSVSQEILDVKVKNEKEDSASPTHECENQEVQQMEEKITIKMEVPDDNGEVAYNELRCEFCQEIYTNPSDWVRHMSDQHRDRGYQAYKDLNKNVGNNAVITCVVCSCACFSAAEWAKHLRIWHTDRELAVANMSESKKSCGKNKKKSSTGDKCNSKKE